nr:hypothetical protein CPGR_05709 [Mycolicibacter nonchromogenicus]
MPMALAMSMPACSTPQREPQFDVNAPCVGATNSGRCRRASRSARSCANAMPLASSSLCMTTLAAALTVIICRPWLDVVVVASFSIVLLEASTAGRATVSSD